MKKYKVSGICIAAMIAAQTSIISPVASAQNVDTPQLTEQQVRRIQNILSTNDRIAQLEKRVSETESEVKASRMAISILAQQLAKEIELPSNNQRKDVAAEIQKVKLRDQNLGDRLEELQGNLIKRSDAKAWLGKDPNEIKEDIESIERKAKEISDILRDKEKKLNEKIDAVCDATNLNVRALHENYDANAGSFNLTGSDCLDDALKKEVQDFYSDKVASDQVAQQMSSMMMMAMSTGNPYVIAAALAVMAIMAIFSDGGDGGSGGEGEPGTGGNSSSAGTVGNSGATGSSPQNGSQPADNQGGDQQGSGNNGSSNVEAPTLGGGTNNSEIKSATVGDVSYSGFNGNLSFIHGGQSFSLIWDDITPPESATAGSWDWTKIELTSADVINKSFKFEIGDSCYEVVRRVSGGYVGQDCDF